MMKANRYRKSLTCGGDIGMAAAAATYAISNMDSWGEARKMPERQAEANKIVLEKQKKDYDAISKRQRQILEKAISRYIDNTNSIIRGDKFKRAFDRVPKPAKYIPVDPCCEQSKAIECNIENLGRGEVLVRGINRSNEQNDLIHILSFDPRFLVTLDVSSKSIQDLSRGILPIGDVVEVLGNNAEQAALSGRIGNTKKTVARDLGVSKLRAQKAGREEFRNHIQWGNTVVSPASRQHDVAETQLSPSERISLALHQAQLIQQSLQNQYNAWAKKDPFKLAKIQARLHRTIVTLQKRASKALLVNTHVPNYAATVTPSVDNTSGLVGAIGSALPYVSASHFFGGPPGSQDGYRGTGFGGGSSGYQGGQAQVVPPGTPGSDVTDIGL